MKTRTHGGARPGAGRPRRFGEETTHVRIPKSLKLPIAQELAAYRRNGALARIALTPLACDPPAQRFPDFAVRVAAGFPSPADDYLEEGIDLNKLLVRNAPATFFYTVETHADSMNLEGIFGGDRILVDRSIEPRSGHLVLALIYGEGATVKQLKMKGSTVSLVPRSTNPQHRTRTLKEGEEVSIIGVVTTVIRQFRV